VGRLLDALRETGRMEDTVVAFTSDHGCMMGEQGEIHKGWDRLRNQCTQLPLIIRHPRGVAAGRRVRGFCQHQDIMPTLLGLLGEPVPERVTGRDLWPQVTGRAGGPDYVVSAFGFCASFRTARWNYVRPWHKTPEVPLERAEQLYDLEADPQELTNVVADHRDVAAELGRRLEAHIKNFAPLTGGHFQRTAEGTDAHLTFDALPPIG